jgi:DNA-binding winged helix-turn-helix (wHTH) protein
VDVPVIPRYFDLLLLLLANRHRVVTRQEIFDRVWAEVVVSDGALSQAVRTIRRSLGDDRREPRFIRTVSRHGYQFVGADVREEPDDGPMPGDGPGEPHTRRPPADARDALLGRLLRQPPFGAATDEERRDAAEELHLLGTADVVDRLNGLAGQAEARAILRDARWAVPGAGDVPILGTSEPWLSIAHVVRLRLRLAAREASNRWGAAALGGTVAGIGAGLAGGAALWLVPESEAGSNVVVALAVVGALAGALGASGVGAGLAAAEVIARSRRATALVACGALGGALSGIAAHLITKAVLAGVFGREVSDLAGWLEGLVLGGAAGLGYAMSTARMPGGGLAGPRGRARGRAVLAAALTTALAAAGLAAGGFHLVASTLDVMALAFDGSDVGLAPLARLLGEEDLKPVTRTLISAFEGLLFGAGLTFGLTHRPGRR